LGLNWDATGKLPCARIPPANGRISDGNPSGTVEGVHVEMVVPDVMGMMVMVIMTMIKLEEGKNPLKIKPKK
jgi:hypothetical protein